jgi:hypothetical protein
LPPHRRLRRHEDMADLLFLALILVVFAALWALVQAVVRR